MLMNDVDLEETVLPFRAQDGRNLERVELDAFKYGLAKPDDVLPLAGRAILDNAERPLRGYDRNGQPIFGARFEKNPRYAPLFSYLVYAAIVLAVLPFVTGQPFLLVLLVVPLSLYVWIEWHRRDVPPPAPSTKAQPCALVFSRDQVFVRVNQEVAQTFSTRELSQFLPKSSLPGERRLVVQPMSGPAIELAVRFLSHEDMSHVGATANDMLHEAKARGALPFR